MYAPTMAYTVSRANVSDAESIVRHVDIPAMQNGPLYRTMFPESGTMTDSQAEEVALWYTEMLEDAIEAGREKFLKVCGPDGTVVGFCGWDIAERKCEHQWARVDGEASGRMTRPREKAWIPGAIDADGWFTLSRALKTERDRALRNKNNTCRLTFMAVDPSHQRRGVGSMMMQRICDEADRQGRCAYVLSAPEAVRLYAKFGFETVGQVETTQGAITSMFRHPREF